MQFNVHLDSYDGPLELLLYLVRKHELEVTEISVWAVTEQYLEYLAILEQIDVDAVGDFLETASTLIELKSRQVLPHGDVQDKVPDDPRQDLVRRLLEYKKYRDAAYMLEERSRQWQDRYSRQSMELGTRIDDPADRPIHKAEIWDLVNAFAHILGNHPQQESATNIRYDDTPIQVFMRRIHSRLVCQGRVSFTQLFSAGAHRSTCVGSFLAILELVRHRHALAFQQRLFGDIWLEPGEIPLPEGELPVAGYDHSPALTNLAA
jgi:segregation and condensation protein A